MLTAHLCPGERLSDLVPLPSQRSLFEVDTERHWVLCVTLWPRVLVLDPDSEVHQWLLLAVHGTLVTRCLEKTQRFSQLRRGHCGQLPCSILTHVLPTAQGCTTVTSPLRFFPSSFSSLSSPLGFLFATVDFFVLHNKKPEIAVSCLVNKNVMLKSKDIYL